MDFLLKNTLFKVLILCNEKKPVADLLFTDRTFFRVW